MSKLNIGTLATLAGLALVSGGCGKSKPANQTDGGGSGGSGGGAGSDGGDGKTVANVSVSGTAAPHALTKMLDPTADFSMLKISIVDPVLELAGAPALGSMNLDTSAANCGAAPTSDAGTGDGGAEAGAGDGGGDGGGTTAASAGCRWTVDPVDIGGITLGLVGTLADLRTGTSRLWVKTGTGMGTSAFINAEKTSKAPITMRQAFAVSRGAETGLATFASAALSIAPPLTGDNLDARGFMIGHVLGKLSAGAPPVGGAVIASAAADKVDIIYPDMTFAGTGTSTAAHGIFLVVPKPVSPATPIVTSWTVTPPTGSALTWDAYTAGTQPGAAFIILMTAKE